MVNIHACVCIYMQYGNKYTYIHKCVDIHSMACISVLVDVYINIYIFVVVCVFVSVSWSLASMELAGQMATSVVQTIVELGDCRVTICP